MLLDHEPSHMGEEEAPLDVVWIAIAIGPFVMASMIASPLDHIILKPFFRWYEEVSHADEPGSQLYPRSCKTVEPRNWPGIVKHIRISKH